MPIIFTIKLPQNKAVYAKNTLECEIIKFSHNENLATNCSPSVFFSENEFLGNQILANHFMLIRKKIPISFQTLSKFSSIRRNSLCPKTPVCKCSFSNSLIIQQVITKEIITVTVVWKSDLN